MEAMKRYYEIITNFLMRINEEEEESIAKAAQLVSEAIEKDKLVHAMVTGGHSSIGAQEMFWRAGGLAPVNPILDPGFSLSYRRNEVQTDSAFT